MVLRLTQNVGVSQLYFTRETVSRYKQGQKRYSVMFNSAHKKSRVHCAQKKKKKKKKEESDQNFLRKVETS